MCTDELRHAIRGLCPLDRLLDLDLPEDQQAMNFQDVLEQAAVCGLETVGEAMDNFYLHAISLLSYSEAPEVEQHIEQEHRAYLEAGGSDEDRLPPEMVARVNKEMEAYFKAQS